MIQYYYFLRTLEQVSLYERRLTLGEISITYGSFKKFREKLLANEKTIIWTRKMEDIMVSLAWKVYKFDNSSTVSDTRNAQVVLLPRNHKRKYTVFKFKTWISDLDDIKLSIGI